MNDGFSAVRRRLLLRSAAAAVVLPRAAWSQEGAPLRLVVPFPEGGRTGHLARLVAGPLGQVLSRPVQVEHRRGEVMHEIAAFAEGPPDGNTLLLATIRLPRRGELAPDAENLLLDSLVPVTFVARDPMVLVMNAQRAEALGIRSAAQLLRSLRTRPGRLTIATGNRGSTDGHAGELFKSLTRTWLVALRTDGLTPDTHAIDEGRADLMFAPLNVARRPIQSGRWRGLGLTATATDGLQIDGLTRDYTVPLLESVEPALRRFAVYDHYSLLAPPRTSPEVAERLQEAMAQTLAIDRVRADVRRTGAVPGGETPTAYRQWERDEAERLRVARERW